MEADACLVLRFVDSAILEVVVGVECQLVGIAPLALRLLFILRFGLYLVSGEDGLFWRWGGCPAGSIGRAAAFLNHIFPCDRPIARIT